MTRSGQAGPGSKRKRVGNVRLLLSTVLLLLSVIVWGFFLNGTLKAEEVISESMHPTVEKGDRVLVRSIGVGAPLQRGDIVVVQLAGPEELPLLKRVAAIPGDEVLVLNNQVFINKKPTRGEVIARNAWPVYQVAHRKLREGEFFVLGDNRDNSWDSVYFGPVQRENIIGRAVLRYAPWRRAGFLDSLHD